MSAAILVAAVLLLIPITWQIKPRAMSELPEPGQDVQDLISAGNKVVAIRAYRKQTGASLLEATRMIKHHAA